MEVRCSSDMAKAVKQSATINCAELVRDQSGNVKSRYMTELPS